MRSPRAASAAASPIALLTDFGCQDAYVGVMKGVLLARCPGAAVIDLCHGVAPQDILGGALLLQSAIPYFPSGTVFLAVVDPGVGGTRRPLCIQSGSYRFVGPDNGLLWLAALRAGTPRAFHLDRPAFWLPQTGATFHGRDIFAPIAAELAGGRTPEAVGSPIPDPVPLALPQPSRTDAIVTGEILYIDHFGNAVTNLRPADLSDPGPFTVRFVVDGHAIRGPATHYEAVAAGQPAVVLGSLGFYEIAVNGGNAAERFHLQPHQHLSAGPESSPASPR